MILALKCPFCSAMTPDDVQSQETVHEDNPSAVHPEASRSEWKRPGSVWKNTLILWGHWGHYGPVL